MFWKKLVSDYLTFTRKDRVGVLVLLFLIGLAYSLPLFFPGNDLPPSYSYLPPADTLEAVQVAADDHYPDRYASYEKEEASNSYETFDFDPNTISTEDWINLGLKPKTAATIQKYLQKGGRFRNPEDLKKIWGLPQGFWERVRDHIHIEKTEKAVSSYPSQPAMKIEKSKLQPIDINSADSAAWEALPGIGATLAGRITNFRAKLGGFHSTDQLREVYGLRDSTILLIKDLLRLNGAVARINLNNITKEELKNHPYFRWKLANAIIAYRNQHGIFKQPEDLRKITLVNDSIYKKILPYTRFD